MGDFSHLKVSFIFNKALLFKVWNNLSRDEWTEEDVNQNFSLYFHYKRSTIGDTVLDYVLK